MIRLELDDRELKQALDKLAARVANMAPVMERLGRGRQESLPSVR